MKYDCYFKAPAVSDTTHYFCLQLNFIYEKYYIVLCIS